MSSPKICPYCGEYEHDCQCLAARKIKKLERELAAANKGARINALVNASLVVKASKEYQRGYDMALDMASATVIYYKWQKGSSNFNQGFMAGKILSMKSKTPAEPPNAGAETRPT